MEVWQAALLGAGWLVGWGLLWRVRGLPPDDGPVRHDGVSVVVPARDEADRLPALLDALAHQSLPPGEIVVVDDESSDATAAVARAGGARVIAGAPVPDGWAGKAWAMQQGAEAAEGGTIVFLDADTEPGPGPELLARVVALLQRRRGVVSVQPYHRMERAWERAAVFFNVVAVMGSGMAAIRARATAAFGPCLALRRVDFLALVGHVSVRTSAVEDVALARRARGIGMRLTTVAGRGQVAFRMYRRLGELLEGFAKNIAAGARSTPPLRLVLIVAWVSACIAAIPWVFITDWPSVLFYAAFAVQIWLMARRLGDFGFGTGAFYPLSLAVFVAVFVWSFVLLVRGTVTWKGRTIRVR